MIKLKTKFANLFQGKTENFYIFNKFYILQINFLHIKYNSK